MTEQRFQDQVTNLATYYGWRWFHAPDNLPRKTRGGRVRLQRTVPGFPDLVLVRGAELIFAELKTDTGRVRPEQREWIHDLQNVSTAVSFARDVALQQPDDKLPESVRVDRGVAVDVYVWRPRDFDDLHARLARGRHRSEPLHNPARDAA